MGLGARSRHRVALVLCHPHPPAGRAQQPAADARRRDPGRRALSDHSPGFRAPGVDRHREPAHDGDDR